MPKKKAANRTKVIKKKSWDTVTENPETVIDDLEEAYDKTTEHQTPPPEMDKSIPKAVQAAIKAPTPLSGSPTLLKQMQDESKVHEEDAKKPWTLTIKKEDIYIWQAGKSLEEMYEYQLRVIDILMDSLRYLTKKREYFTLGQVYSSLKLKGYNIRHQDIDKLLKKYNIHGSSRGTNTYQSSNIVHLIK